ncbi:DUF2975 family protein [Breznakia blatticola]|uniref:DUF2975 family protein n=1 Tax=Breznakia blatticola TaxID=1754012 RepID=A0A4R8A9N3_9FIRM|nr:DUF2975 domain-containing protein [Breznakia blatticola]TDW26441.1 DUF2975 family protein [Breznakia blatticola]
MKGKHIPTILFIFITLILVFVAFLYGFFIPVLAEQYTYGFPELESIKNIVLVFIECTGIPVLIILGLGYAVGIQIMKFEHFTRKTAKYMRSISVLSLFDAIYFGIGMCIMAFFGYIDPPTIIGSGAAIIFALAVAGASYALSYFIYEAAKLQEESELTI